MMKVPLFIASLFIIISAFCLQSAPSKQPSQPQTNVNSPTPKSQPVISDTPPLAPATGTITGHTLDSGGSPFPDMPVKLVDLPALSTTSNGNGAYKLTKVPVGHHTIMASNAGFGSGQFDVFVRENETSVVDLKLNTYIEKTPNFPGPGQEFPGQGPLENAPLERSWTDSWYLNFGTMKLNHNGAKVSGEYHNDLNDVSGTIKGTLSGKVFDGTWSNGTRSGSLHWVFSSNGDSFTGNFNGSTSWCGARTGKPFPAGCSFSGTWTAHVAGNNKCTMKLVRTDLSVKGTYCNGKVSGTISYSRNANEAILNGTWTTRNSGPFRLYLIGYDGLKFQGNWNRTNAWCGWRSNQTAPTPCLR